MCQHVNIFPTFPEEGDRHLLIIWLEYIIGIKKTVIYCLLRKVASTVAAAKTVKNAIRRSLITAYRWPLALY